MSTCTEAMASQAALTLDAGTTRRHFLTATTLSMAALGYSTLARGSWPSNRIRVGVIGTGVRGKYLIGNLPDSASVVSICDCAKQQMATALAPKGEFAQVLGSFRERQAAHCSTHQDYRRMLDRKKLDAVIIATPDHHHVQAAMLALRAGLDVYLEKPISLTIREGRLLADMVKKTGRVLQVGSQQRSMEVNRFACEFIRGGGPGRVTRVNCPNYPGPIANVDLPVEPSPDCLDWDLFHGPSPLRPHNRRPWVKDEFKVGDLMWRGWDLFRDYSGHLMTNWGAHDIDMVQYALGMDASGPVAIAPLRETVGGSRDVEISEAALLLDWKNKWHKRTPRPEGTFASANRFLPVTMEYAKGTILNFLPNVDATTFYGERGTMTIGRNRFSVDPADLVSFVPDPALADKWNGSGHVARPHLQNWIDCIKSRNLPNAPAETGHRTATICHLANIAREQDRPLSWNPETEEFLGDQEANETLDRPRRKGFQLPPSVQLTQ